LSHVNKQVEFAVHANGTTTTTCLITPLSLAHNSDDNERLFHEMAYMGVDVKRKKASRKIQNAQTKTTKQTNCCCCV